jgi:spectinomycin phosphotransferase
MLEKQPISEQRIVDCLITDYGIDVSTLTFLPLGADMHASVYKAQARDKSAYFIKLNHYQLKLVGCDLDWKSRLL